MYYTVKYCRPKIIIFYPPKLFYIVKIIILVQILKKMINAIRFKVNLRLSMSFGW